MPRTTKTNTNKSIKVEVPSTPQDTTLKAGNNETKTSTQKVTPVQPKVQVTTCKGNVVEYSQVSNRALKAKITAYSDAQRTQVVKEFESFVEAKRWLEVTNVGTSLERASETGKPSRGYWWRVSM